MLRVIGVIWYGACSDSEVAGDWGIHGMVHVVGSRKYV